MASTTMACVLFTNKSANRLNNLGGVAHYFQNFGNNSLAICEIYFRVILIKSNINNCFINSTYKHLPDCLPKLVAVPLV